MCALSRTTSADGSHGNARAVPGVTIICSIAIDSFSTGHKYKFPPAVKLRSNPDVLPASLKFTALLKAPTQCNGDFLYEIQR